MEKQTVLELTLSTGAENAHSVAKGLFHYNLPHYVNLNNISDDINVAVKNVRMPEITKKLTFKLYMSRNVESYQAGLYKSYTVEYKSLSELCTQIECVANMSINLVWRPDENKPEKKLDTNFIISISYLDNRFVLKMNSDLVIYMSCELIKMLGLSHTILAMYTESQKVGKSEAELISAWDEPVKLQKHYYLSNQYCYFIEPKNEEISFLLYDILQNYTIMEDGSQYPILFKFNIIHPEKKPNKWISVKKLSVKSIKNFKFAFYNSARERFSFGDIDLKKNPFMVTLVFYLPG